MLYGRKPLAQTVGRCLVALSAKPISSLKLQERMHDLLDAPYKSLLKETQFPAQFLRRDRPVWLIHAPNCSAVPVEGEYDHKGPPAMASNT